MDCFTVSLFGHREIDNYSCLEKQLIKIIKELIQTKSYVTFLIGRNGEFDIFASTVIKRIQNAMGKENNEFICVLPYYEKDLEYYEKYYDGVTIPECVEKTHPKNAIIKRNKWMIEQSDLLLFYVERDFGGAYSALKYAEKLKKPIINLTNN